MVDAGSAGFATFPGFRAYGIERWKTRVLAFLHISSIGLTVSGLGGDASVPGELDLLKFVDTDYCVECIRANADVLVGVKIRLFRSGGDENPAGSKSASDGGYLRGFANEHVAYERALKAARLVGLPLMVHHAESSVPLSDAPGKMERGDIYTHCFHGFESTLVDPVTRKLHPEAWRARERGVIMDVGSGQGSFNWTVAEIATQEGFWPDTISTDLHSGCVDGPTYDLPTVMTRFLHLGMPLFNVIEKTTIAPARAIGWDDRIGSLAPGREADVAIFSLQEVDLELEDCQAQLRRVRQRLVPISVWRAGERFDATLPDPWPNPVTINRQKAWWPKLAVRDAAL